MGSFFRQRRKYFRFRHLNAGGENVVLSYLSLGKAQKFIQHFHTQLSKHKNYENQQRGSGGKKPEKKEHIQMNISI